MGRIMAGSRTDRRTHRLPISTCIGLALKMLFFSGTEDLTASARGMNDCETVMRSEIQGTCANVHLDAQPLSPLP